MRLVSLIVILMPMVAMTVSVILETVLIIIMVVLKMGSTVEVRV